MKVPNQNQNYSTSEAVAFFCPTAQAIELKPLTYTVSYALMDKHGKEKAKEMTSKYFGKESAKKLATDVDYLKSFLDEMGVKNILFGVVVKTSSYTFDYSGLKVELV